MRVRDTYGGASIFYYGGGGQGNHLCGSYGASTRRALGSVFSSNALAQEKTGEFWVDHQLFGTGLSGGYQQAEVAIFVGKNPWQSHGFQRARPILRDIAADPNRALVVIDPRLTETAEMADFHLRVRPGTDAFCLAAILGVLVQEDLISHDYIRERTQNSDELFAALNEVPVADYCGRAGLEESLVRDVARRIARASSVSVYEDLGIEQSLHSTLNSYLEKLLFAVTGNVGKAGGMNAGTSLTGMFGGALSSQTSPVGGHRIIGGMIPANVIPDEILTDHPKRFRAMLVESENPAHSVADSTRMREALRSLEFVVVIDVAMSETAREAHYVLPASSQYEKWEATFFGAAFHTETEFANTLRSARRRMSLPIFVLRRRRQNVGARARFAHRNIDHDTNQRRNASRIRGCRNRVRRFSSHIARTLWSSDSSDHVADLRRCHDQPTAGRARARHRHPAGARMAAGLPTFPVIDHRVFRPTVPVSCRPSSVSARLVASAPRRRSRGAACGAVGRAWRPRAAPTSPVVARALSAVYGGATRSPVAPRCSDENPAHSVADSTRMRERCGAGMWSSSMCDERSAREAH